MPPSSILSQNAERHFFLFWQVDRTQIVVSDDGRGIPDENLGKIFDPFFTTRGGQGGTGLGLHIVHNIVTSRLGGAIECRSEVGKGTEFVISLPS